MAIDSARKRTAVMGMGAPAGAILPYPISSIGIIGRSALIGIGFTTALTEFVLSGLDVEHTFEIHRFIKQVFNIDRTITHTFELT